MLISRQQTDSLAPFSILSENKDDALGFFLTHHPCHRGATSNQLYLRLTLAATLRSLLEDSDPTGAELTHCTATFVYHRLPIAGDRCSRFFVDSTFGLLTASSRGNLWCFGELQAFVAVHADLECSGNSRLMFQPFLAGGLAQAGCSGIQNMVVQCGTMVHVLCACGPLPGRACKCTLPPFAAIWAGSAVRHQVCMMVRRCDVPWGGSSNSQY